MSSPKDFIGSQSTRDIRATSLKDLEGLVGSSNPNERLLGATDRVEVDDLTSGIERFRAAYKTGGSTLTSSLANFDASIASLMGNEERMNRSLARAKEEQEQGAYYLLDSQPFEEFIEAPTFSGFVDSAIEATGQFAPTAITSIIAALTGAGVGAGLSYLTGSTRLFAAAGSTGIQTIPATIAARGVLKSEVEDVLKKKVTIDVLKKQGRKTAIALTPGEEKIINLLYPYLRNQIRNKYATRGAIAGAFAQEMPIGAGIAFGDYAEQGMTDPVKAFRSQGQGAIFGAIGVGSEALIYKSIVSNMKSKAAKSLINERAVLDAPLKSSIAKEVAGKALKTGVLTGISEGIAEGLQEELSIQQKLGIDADYSRTQARLDRLQAYYMGTIGGMGIGTGTGSGTAVIGKMRELVEIGYEKRMFDLYQKVKEGENNPILETQNDLSAQFMDLLDPKIDRAFVWVDQQNYEEFAPIANRINKTPGLEKTMIPGVGTFYTLDPNLNQRFVNTMSAAPLNRQRLLNFLDIFGKNPPTEGDGLRVVVSVRGRNNEILKRYDVKAGDEEQSAISAAQAYIGGPDGTNGRSIDVKTLQEFNEERRSVLPQQEEETQSMVEDFENMKQGELDFGQEQEQKQEQKQEQEQEEDLGARDELGNIIEEQEQEQEQEEDEFTSFDTEQERLFAQNVDTEPSIVQNMQAPQGQKDSKNQGSFENPIGKKKGGKAKEGAPYSVENKNLKFTVKEGDDLFNQLLQVYPQEFVTDFIKLVRENKISNTAANRYLEVYEQLSKDNPLDNQILGFAEKDTTAKERLVIYKYNVPGAGKGEFNADTARRVVVSVDSKFVSLNPKDKKYTKKGQRRYASWALRNNNTYDSNKSAQENVDSGAITPVDINRFTVQGRNIQKRKDENIPGDLQSAIAGFGYLLGEMEAQGYTLIWSEGNVNEDIEKFVPFIESSPRLQNKARIYNTKKTFGSLERMQQEIARETPRSQNTPLTETESLEGLEIGDPAELEVAEQEADQAVADIEEDLKEIKRIAELDLATLEEGLTEEEKKAGVFNLFVKKDQGVVRDENGKPKVLRKQTPFQGSPTTKILDNGQEVTIKEPVDLKKRQDQIQKRVERKEKELFYADLRRDNTVQSLEQASQTELDLRAQNDPTDQYAFDSSDLFREWAKRPATTKEQQQEQKEKRDGLKEQGIVTYSSTLEQHLGLDFLNIMKRIARNTLGLKRNLLIFSSTEEIIVEDPILQRRIDAALSKFTPEFNQRGINIRGRGNTDYLIIQTREGFNLEDQGVRLFTVAHEIGHSFIYQELDRSLKVPRLRKALQKAFEKAKALGTTNQYQLEGEAGFQEWISDQIAVFLVNETKQAKNQTESFFKNIASKIKAFFTKYAAVAKRRFTSDPVFNDYIQEVLQANKTNNFNYGVKAAIEEDVENVKKVITKGAEKTLKRTVKKIIESGEIPNSKVDSATRTLRTIFQDKDGLLRSFGAPGEALAKLFKQRVGTKEQTAYLTKVFSLSRAKMNEVQTILGIEEVGDMTQEVEDILQELEVDDVAFEELSPKAQQIRTFLTKHYKDLQLDELGVGFLETYFPRLFLMEELLNEPGKREALIQLLVEYNPTLTRSDATDAVEIMLKDVEEDPNFSKDEEETYAVGMLANRAELFKNIPTNVLREAGLLEDASYSLQRYIQNSVKRRGFADFGGTKAIKEQLNKIKDPKERELAEQAVKAILGRVDPIESNLFRNVNNVGLFFNVATLLPLSVFASFPDLAGPILRYRGFPPFLETMRTIMAAMSEEELAKFGKDIGATGINAMNEQYVGAGELQYTSKKTKKATNAFFRFIQLEQFTNFTRRFAAGMARIFLIDNANKALAGDETALRYLEELDITAEEIIAWGDGDITAPSNQRVRLALARFVDEAIVRPNSAERPLWASDPRFALVWQLKSFFYSYGKNIVMGTGREMQARMAEAGLTGAAIPLFMAAVTILPLTMLGLDMRERFKIGLAWALPGVSPQDKDYRRSLSMSPGEYSIEIMDRSGLLGPYTMALPLFVNEKRYGDPLWVGPLGPTIGTGYDLISGDIKPKNLIPFYSAL